LDLTRREREIMRVAREMGESEAIRPSRGVGGGGSITCRVSEIFLNADDPTDIFMTVPIKCTRFTLGALEQDPTPVGDPFWVLPLIHGRKPLNVADFLAVGFPWKLYHPQIDVGDIVEVKRITGMEVQLAYLETIPATVCNHFIVSHTYQKWDKRSSLPPPCN
jgi:hypothetical protein